MPKATIKSLQAELATNRILREKDQEHIDWQRIEIEKARAEHQRLRAEIDERKTNERWLKTLIQSLALPQQERTRF